MLATARLAALAAVLITFAAPVATAEDCQTVVLQRATGLIQALGRQDQLFADQIKEMDASVAACPDHAWINMLGAEMDMVVYRTLIENNGGSINQSAVDYLGRAYARSNVFINAPEADQGTVYPFGFQYASRIDYSLSSNTRRSIIEALIDLDGLGVKHPYLTGESIKTCNTWVTSDALTVNGKITSLYNLPYFTFIDATIAACRDGRSQIDRMPLALKANKIVNLIEREDITAPEEITRLLTEARDLAIDFMRDDEMRTTYFTEADDRRLKTLMRKYGVHDGKGPVTIDPSLWMTPEYVGSEVAIRSIAYAMAGYWTPLAAGETNATPQEVAKARNDLGTWLIKLNREGAAAGLAEETRKMLEQAIYSFSSGGIRPPEAVSTSAMPDWYLNVLINMLKPLPPAAGADSMPAQ